MPAVNVVVISGKVKRVFDARDVGGKPSQSAVLTQDSGNGRTMEFSIGGFGEYAVKQFKSLSPGDDVIVQGRYSSRKYTKDEYWITAVEVSVDRIEHVGETGGFTADEFIPVAAGPIPDDTPF